VEEQYRPLALRVMAEYMDDDPVWDSDADHLGPVELEQLGVSAHLVERLRAWNEHYHGIALTDLEFRTPGRGSCLAAGRATAGSPTAERAAGHRNPVRPRP
jgi:hypothetical protein